MIDGLSNDGTIDLIKDNAGRNPGIRFISEKDQGVYDAFNKGLVMAKGEWIYFLGSDDRLHNTQVLQKIFDKLQEQDGDLLYGNVLFANSKKPYDGPFSFDKLLERNISHQAIFYNKNIFTLLGGYKIRYKIMADWEINLRCFFRGLFKEIFLDLVIADFAVEGISTQMDVLFLREILIPEKLRQMNTLDPAQYLGKISLYDSCWRLLRNAKIRSEEELIRFAQDKSIPKVFLNMLSHQVKISPGLLKNGFISKSCMFMSWLANRINRSL
jgi:Glycosyl transferase family 2.